jgi:hypothetical protein
MSSLPQTTGATLQQLLALLDPDTLSAVTERLHKVAAVQQEAPEQMLLAFIDDCLAAHEEEGDDDSVVAGLILEEIESR